MTEYTHGTRNITIDRRHIHVDGVVQGVGFRPFVYGLAVRFGLTGWVLNSSAGVDIEVQGESASVSAFQQALHDEAPRLARIDRVSGVAIAPVPGDDAFVIRHSTAADGISLVSPDVATCPDCISEIFDPSDRRYRYPFTNCTNCGPRYTIIQHMPYDRPQTTMGQFTMCPACQSEYDNPLDRRFHAQPNACPVCGPSVSLTAGVRVLTDLDGLPDDLARVAKLLQEGLIVAIRGLGGFHLACDATNPEAVARLRERKSRPHKPFAVMVASLEELRHQCDVNADEEALLSGISAPVVLLYQRETASIAANVSPDNPMLGVMLPYTPLHHILLRDAGVPLVMTSGNVNRMPITVTNDDAMASLAHITDAFLLHDRPIHMRCDDAVWWVDRFAGEQDAVRQPLRRSRGDAPYPVRLVSPADRQVLAVGAEMKNTFCLVRERDAFLSQHIGEVDSLEALAYFRAAMAHLRGVFKAVPDLIAHDLHPAYLTTRLAHELAESEGIPLVGVQHHHAHIAACLAEHGFTDPVIGVAFDGTGFGSDGAIWGGEFLAADLRGFERAGHLAYMPLPGGDAAVRRPYRTAWGYLLSALGEIPALESLVPYSEHEKEIVIRQVERGLNTPQTSSCGRLFDAVAAITGVCGVSTFEAQAAIALELIARQVPQNTAQPYNYTIGDDGVIRLEELLAGVVMDVQCKRSSADIALAFHHTVADMVVRSSQRIRGMTGLNTVVLTGGVFQNRLLLRLAREALRQDGFAVLTHRQVPANDGGLCLGQAAVALSQSR